MRWRPWSDALEALAGPVLAVTARRAPAVLSSPVVLNRLVGLPVAVKPGGRRRTRCASSPVLSTAAPLLAGTSNCPSEASSATWPLVLPVRAARYGCRRQRLGRRSGRPAGNDPARLLG